MLTAHDQPARTRHAFQLWRANRQGRTQIPLELRQKAVSLLDRFSVSRVARELRLDSAKLRKRSHASALPPLTTTTSRGLRFVEVSAAELTSMSSSSLLTRDEATCRPDETASRLAVKRADGSRLSLHLPASEWSRVEALCSLFLRT